MVTNLHTHNQVHELIFSLSFYVNFAVHLVRLMALRKHTQTYQLRYALSAAAGRGAGCRREDRTSCIFMPNSTDL